MDDVPPPSKYTKHKHFVSGGVLGDEWDVEDETQDRKQLRAMGFDNIVPGYTVGKVPPPPLDLGGNAWDNDYFVMPRMNNVIHMDGPVSQYPRGHDSQYVRGLPNDILGHLRSSDYVVDEKDQLPATGFRLPPQYALDPLFMDEHSVPRKYSVPKLKTPDEVKALKNIDQRFFDAMNTMRVKTFNDPMEIQYMQDLKNGVYDGIKVVGGNKPRYDPREDPKFAHYSKEFVSDPVPDYFLYNVNPGGRLHIVHPVDAAAKTYWSMLTERAKRRASMYDMKLPEPVIRDKFSTGLAQRAAARRKREETFLDDVPPPSKVRKVDLPKVSEMKVDVPPDFRLPGGLSTLFEPVDFRDPRRLFKPDFVKAFVAAAVTGDKWRQHQCDCNHGRYNRRK